MAGDSAKPTQITRHPTGVGLWRFSPDSRRIYFAAPDTLDPDARLRLENRFDVRIRNMETPLYSLWALDLDSKRTTRLTRDTTYSVADLTISPDGKYLEHLVDGGRKRLARELDIAHTVTHPGDRLVEIQLALVVHGLLDRG